MNGSSTPKAGLRCLVWPDAGMQALSPSCKKRLLKEAERKRTLKFGTGNEDFWVFRQNTVNWPSARISRCCFGSFRRSFRKQAIAAVLHLAFEGPTSFVGLISVGTRPADEQGASTVFENSCRDKRMRSVPAKPSQAKTQELRSRRSNVDCKPTAFLRKKRYDTCLSLSWAATTSGLQSL